MASNLAMVGDGLHLLSEVRHFLWLLRKRGAGYRMRGSRIGRRLLIVKPLLPGRTVHCVSGRSPRAWPERANSTTAARQGDGHNAVQADSRSDARCEPVGVSVADKTGTGFVQEEYLSNWIGNAVLSSCCVDRTDNGENLTAVRFQRHKTPMTPGPNAIRSRQEPIGPCRRASYAGGAISQSPEARISKRGLSLNETPSLEIRQYSLGGSGCRN